MFHGEFTANTIDRSQRFAADFLLRKNLGCDVIAAAAEYHSAEV